MTGSDASRRNDEYLRLWLSVMLQHVCHVEKIVSWERNNLRDATLILQGSSPNRNYHPHATPSPRLCVQYSNASLSKGRQKASKGKSATGIRTRVEGLNKSAS